MNHEHFQKHLILLTLRELYVIFKETFQSIKLGFSKFCSLRPPECVIAAASGIHNVCVCQTHQNFYLLLWIFNRNYKCRDVINAITCDKNNRNCLMRLCKECTGKEYVEKKMFELLTKEEEFKEDFDMEEILED